MKRADRGERHPIDSPSPDPEAGGFEDEAPPPDDSSWDRVEALIGKHRGPPIPIEEYDIIAAEDTSR